MTLPGSAVTLRAPSGREVRLDLSPREGGCVDVTQTCNWKPGAVGYRKYPSAVLASVRETAEHESAAVEWSGPPISLSGGRS